MRPVASRLAPRIRGEVFIALGGVSGVLMEKPTTDLAS
jgi:hypothetical protein